MCALVCMMCNVWCGSVYVYMYLFLRVCVCVDVRVCVLLGVRRQIGMLIHNYELSCL